MNQFFARLLFAAVPLFCAHFCFAQSVDQVVNHQLQQDPQEKIYIHYDKNSYVTGDTVWFKAYLLQDRSAPGRVKTFIWSYWMRTANY